MTIGSGTRTSAVLGTALLCVALLLGGCSGGGAAESTSVGDSTNPSAGSPAGTTVTAEAIQAALPPTQLVELLRIPSTDLVRAEQFTRALPWRTVTADGVTQAVACTGQGGPVVVYVNGLIMAANWTWLLAAQDQSTRGRVCLVDRAGTGLAPARPPASSANGPAANARELLAVLGAAGETGPFVLVGWSYGGLVARAAAAQNPDDVAGIVLVDASDPTAWRSDPQGWTEAGSVLDMATGEAVLTSAQPITPAPVVEIVAGIGPVPGSASRLSSISTNAALAAVPGVGHTIPQQNPAAVVAATSAVLDSIAAGDAPLGPCPAPMAAAGLECSAIATDSPTP